MANFGASEQSKAVTATEIRQHVIASGPFAGLMQAVAYETSIRRALGIVERVEELDGIHPPEGLSIRLALTEEAQAQMSPVPFEGVPILDTEPDTGHVYIQESSHHRQLMQICENCRSPRLIPDPETIRGYRQNPWPCHRATSVGVPHDWSDPDSRLDVFCVDCDQRRGLATTSPNCPRPRPERLTTDAERISAQAEENSMAMTPTDPDTEFTEEQRRIHTLAEVNPDEFEARARTYTLNEIEEEIDRASRVAQEHLRRAKRAEGVAEGLRSHASRTSTYGLHGVAGMESTARGV